MVSPLYQPPPARYRDTGEQSCLLRRNLFTAVDDRERIRIMLRFFVYDVFTTTPFTGNPLAIVEGADGLSTAQMQTIARQFNLSETIFVQTPDNPAHTAKVRIFFPTAEIPFAGHPTIGCALNLAGETATHVTLEEQAGLVPVTITRDGPTVQAEFTAPKLPRALPATPGRATMAAALGLTEQDLAPTPL